MRCAVLGWSICPPPFPSIPLTACCHTSPSIPATESPAALTSPPPDVAPAVVLAASLRMFCPCVPGGSLGPPPPTLLLTWVAHPLLSDGVSASRSTPRLLIIRCVSASLLPSCINETLMRFTRTRGTSPARPSRIRLFTSPALLLSLASARLTACVVGASIHSTFGLSTSVASSPPPRALLRSLKYSFILSLNSSLYSSAADNISCASRSHLKFSIRGGYLASSLPSLLVVVMHSSIVASLSPLPGCIRSTSITFGISLFSAVMKTSRSSAYNFLTSAPCAPIGMGFRFRPLITT